MSAYTEAHFAATLLHCGPHVMHCKECGWSDSICPNVTIYRSRVYSYFFTLFPSMVESALDEVGEANNQEHEWKRFWREYRAWVTS